MDAALLAPEALSLQVSRSRGANRREVLSPASLTQFFVGEPFFCCLHVENVTSLAIVNVVMRVELHMNFVKDVLFINTGNAIEIQPSQSYDIDVHHDINTAGDCNLQILISYNVARAPLSEPHTFKRVYRFSMVHPFALTHRASQLERDLLVECNVCNKTTGAIFLTSVQFACTDGFEALTLDGSDESIPSNPCMLRFSPNLIRPQSAQRISFMVIPKGEAADVGYCRDLSNLGSLALSWRLPDGLSGCVEGHKIQLVPCSKTPLDLHVASCPFQVAVEVPFELEVEILNRSSRAVDPTITFDLRQMVGVKLCGNMQRDVGRMEPFSAVKVLVQLFASTPGIHALRGVSLVDNFTKAKSDFDTICEILAF